MRRHLLFLLLLCTAAPAQEARAPLIFFREPDADTARDIEDLLSSKGLGSSTRNVRTEARKELRAIGSWAVPALQRTIAGRQRVKNPRIVMNAAMTLARIHDPRCLPELREAAGKAPEPEVRQAACLALGCFGDPDGESCRLLLRLVQDARDAGAHRRGAALALGRLADAETTAALLGALTTLPREDRFLAAALLLAAAVRTPQAAVADFLEHEEEVVRRVAAGCLLIRPLSATAAERLLTLLHRPAAPRDRNLRPLLCHALAAMERTDRIREQLLRCATRTTEDKDVRIAATIGLAAEWGNSEHYRKLRQVLLKGRNDPLAAALLFAMVQTGVPEAVDELLQIVEGGSDLSRFYAAGSLLYVASLARPGEAHPRERQIFDTIRGLRGVARDANLQDMVNLAGVLAYESDLGRRAELARKWFRGTPDPYALHLWDWTREDRAWATLNDLLTVLLELDDIADKGNPLEGSLVGGSATRGNDRPVAATPAEQDLLDFLREDPPYFGPGDLGDR